MWEKIKDILIFKSFNFKFKSKVCVCSFDKTLIKQYLNASTIELFSSNVIETLVKLNENGYSIIVIENQFNCDTETIKNNINKFFEFINIKKNKLPILLTFILKKNKFKKPQTNIWDFILKYNRISAEKINLKKSLCIGTNLGRVKNYLYTADKSDIDMAFCMNIQIHFIRSPQQIFLHDDTSRKWAWNNDIISVETRKHLIDYQKEKVEEVEFEDFVPTGETTNGNRLIIVSGPPTSGKTLLANRIISYLKSNRMYSKRSKNIILNKIPVSKSVSSINKNLEKIKQRIDEYIYQSMETSVGSDSVSGLNVILISTMGLQKIRKLYNNFIENTLNDWKFEVSIVEIKTTVDVCYLLNQFKLQITNDDKIIETSRRTIYNYFREYTDIRNDDLSFSYKFVEFPLVLREKKELYYNY